jgi:4-diphosphocytidyl-2-C-methyl-D-erythritol kinase
VKLLAPAKINLHLRVAPAASDGFHPLLSWMCTVGLFDNLVLNRTADSNVRLSCDDSSLPCDGTNLVVKAANAMRPFASRQIEQRQFEDGQAVGEDGLAIELLKKIPMGGGLGGGSSDAARIVVGLNRYWDLKLPVDRLSAIAATLGSDVAFFCHGPSSICSGRGQIVRPIGAPKPTWVLLILPPIAVPTGPVYRRFDEMLSQADRVHLEQAVATEPDWDAWRLLDAKALLPLLVNDLERPAFDLFPKLAALREELEQYLGRIVRMSGSGSSLFTLYDDASEATDAAEKINRRARVDSRVHSGAGPAANPWGRAIAVLLAPQIVDDLIDNDLPAR